METGKNNVLLIQAPKSEQEPQREPPTEAEKKRAILCTDGAPKMPMSDWWKISRALNLLERKEAADG